MTAELAPAPADGATAVAAQRPGVIAATAGMLRHPRRTLDALDPEGPRRGAWAMVVVAALTAMVLQVLGYAVEPYPATPAGDTSRLSGQVLSVVLVVVVPAFWYFEAGVVDAAVRLMSGPRDRRRRYRATIALTYPVLIGYGLVPLLQAFLERAGAGVDVVNLVGLLDLLVLAWFIGLATFCAMRVYDVPGLNALAAALLPYAVVTAILFVVTISAAVIGAR